MMHQQLAFLPDQQLHMQLLKEKFHWPHLAQLDSNVTGSKKCQKTFDKFTR